MGPPCSICTTCKEGLAARPAWQEALLLQVGSTLGALACSSGGSCAAGRLSPVAGSSGAVIHVAALVHSIMHLVVTVIAAPCAAAVSFLAGLFLPLCLSRADSFAQLPPEPLILISLLRSQHE